MARCPQRVRCCLSKLQERRTSRNMGSIFTTRLTRNQRPHLVPQNRFYARLHHTSTSELAAALHCSGSLLCLRLGRVKRRENGLQIRRNVNSRCCGAKAAGRSDSYKTP